MTCLKNFLSDKPVRTEVGNVVSLLHSQSEKMAAICLANMLALAQKPRFNRQPPRPKKTRAYKYLPIKLVELITQQHANKK